MNSAQTGPCLAQHNSMPLRLVQEAHVANVCSSGNAYMAVHSQEKSVRA